MSKRKACSLKELKVIQEIDPQTKKHIERFLAGRDAWNEWANKMLARKAELERVGKWKVEERVDQLNRSRLMSADSKNPDIQSWLDEAYVDFSYYIFQTDNNDEQEFIQLYDFEIRQSYKQITILEVLINFEGFIFPSSADFNGAILKGKINFGNVTFEGKADFRRVHFLRTVNFAGSKFKAPAVYVNAKFLGKAFFNDIIFNELALFSASKFSSETNFMSSKFMEGIHCYAATFKGITIFNKSIFQDESEFGRSNFLDGVDFKDAKFEEIAIFEKSNFGDETEFSRTEFQKNAVFVDVKFEEKITFGATKFLGPADFSNCTFKEYTNFSWSIFQNVVVFDKAMFFSASDFIQVNFEKHVGLVKTSFVKKANFGAILVKRGFNLENTTFNSKIPNFTQANFLESPRLDHSKIIPSPKIFSPFSWQRYFWQERYFSYLYRLSRRLFLQSPKFIWTKFTNAHRDKNEESHYRALKRLAIQAHDHENEMKFFAGEIRSRRHITDCLFPWKKGFASSARYWAGVFYEVFSDFGRSFIRPIAYWGITFFIFVNLTLSGAGLHDKTKCHNSQLTPKEAAYTIGLKNSLLILGLTKTNIVKQAELCLYGINKNGEAEREPKPYDPKIKRAYQAKPTKADTTKTDIPFKAVVQGITHSLLSLLFIFLLLLAIRNQFKIK